MFTGIIRKVSSVTKAVEKNGSLFLEIRKPRDWKIKEGDSVAINGVCSTVRKVNGMFQVEYMPETIKKTTVGNFQKGTIVNLERSLKMSDFLDGHLVQGHVDTRGRVKEIKPASQSVIMKIAIPFQFSRFIAEKGSVTIDGISLTVVETGSNWFSVSLVSYTLKNTNLGQLKLGDEVNIETDMIAKYLDKLLSQRYAKKTRK